MEKDSGTQIEAYRVQEERLFLSALLFVDISLGHICQSQGPRATSGPREGFLRPLGWSWFIIRTGPQTAASRQPADLLHAPILHFPQCNGDAPSSRLLHFNIYWHSSCQHHSKINFQIPIKNGKTEGGHWEPGVSNKVGVGVFVHGGSWKTCVSSVWRKCGGTERV